MTAKRVLDSVADVRRDLARMWARPVRVDVERRRPGGPSDDGAPALGEFVVFPTATRPRIVASASSRAARAASMRRYSHSTGPAGRAARLATAAAIRAGVTDRLLPDRLVVRADGGPPSSPEATGSLVDALAEVFGTDVVVSLAVGAVRANRKPVLHVLTPAGRTLGFAKLALSPLATELVRREAANLETLGRHGFRHLELPRVLHHGTWAGNDLLVMTALDTPLRRHAGARQVPVDAMAELAAVDGVEEAPLGGSAFLAALRRVADTAAPADDAVDLAAARFGALLDRFATVHGDHELRFGSWHGDWGPWNMAWTPGRVRVWDWERFAGDVPYGLDALHYTLPPLPPRKGAADDGVAWLRISAASALEPFGVAPGTAALVLTCYVGAIVARFLPDSRTEHGTQLRARVTALLDLFDALLAQPWPVVTGTATVTRLRGRS